MSDELSTKPATNPVGLVIPEKLPQKDIEEYLNEFIVLFYFVNPLKDSVRLVLDDGNIKLWLKRDKFEKIMTDLLNESLDRKCQEIIYRIKLSLGVYGGMFWLDRVNNDFREVHEQVDFENIKPNQIFEIARDEMPTKESPIYNLRQINKEYNENLIDKFSFTQVKNTFTNTFNRIIRSIPNKKKRPTI